MKGEFSWCKTLSMIIVVTMCVAFFQTPLLADTTEEAEEVQTDGITEDETVYISTIEISDLDAPTLNCYPDGEVTIVTKTTDGTVIDAVENYVIKWHGFTVGKNTEDLDGYNQGYIYISGMDSPTPRVYDKDFFDDWLSNDLDEEFSLNVHAQINLTIKEGYAAAEDIACYIDGRVIKNSEEQEYIYMYDNNITISPLASYDEVEKMLDEQTTEPTEEPTEPTEPTEEPTEPTEEGGAKNTYGVIVGADGTWDGDSDYVVEVKSASDDEHCLDRFVKATVDDHELVIDEECTITKGSTIVTIKSSYLKTLSEGSHTITVYFTDNSVTTTLTIKASGSASGTESTNTTPLPATGEIQSPVMYIGAGMIATACAVFGSVIISRKRRAEA